jgi:hypothetical protein
MFRAVGKDPADRFQTAKDLEPSIQTRNAFPAGSPDTGAGRIAHACVGFTDKPLPLGPEVLGRIEFQA